ncbi:MAG: glycine zipper 2TM domain-containing protein [Parvularculaceae bacterium]
MTVSKPFSMKFRAAAIAALSGFALSACVSDLSSGTYDRASVGVPQETLEGTVVAIRPIRIEGTQSGIGAGTGAIVGGALGSTVGGGTAERVAVGALGAVLGGVLGSAVERGTTSRQGFEYTINLDNGNTVTIAQGDPQPVTGEGGRVRVLYGPGYVRVAPAYGGGYYQPYQ